MFAVLSLDTMNDSSYANDGTAKAKVIFDEVPSKRTCMANIGLDDFHYESCGLHLRKLKNGTYKCKKHGVMLV